MREFKPLIPILAVFCLIFFKSYVFVGTPWWDESVYAGIAKNLVEKQTFGINMMDQEAFRPPLYPAVLSVLYFLSDWNVLKIAYLLNLMIVLLTAFLIYRTARLLEDEVTGIIAAIMFLSFPQFLFWSTKALVEPLEAFLVTLFLYVWVSFEDGRRLILAPVLIALAFLSKYILASLAILFILLVLKDENRGAVRTVLNRNLAYGVMISLLILLPWMIHSYRVYGNPLGSALYNLYLVNEVTQNMPPTYYLLKFYDTFWIPGVIFVPAAFYLLRKNEPRWFAFVAWFFIFFALMSILVGEKQTRYLMPLVPAMALVNAKFLRVVMYKKEMLALLSFVLLSCVFTFSLVYGAEKAFSNKMERYEIVEASEIINQGDGRIMAQNYPMYHLLTGREVIWYPADVWAIDEFISKYNVSFVVYDSCSDAPEWAEAYLDNNATFKKVYVHTNWCNLTVYEVDGS